VAEAVVGTSQSWEYASLVSDPSAPSGFYLARRQPAGGSVTMGNQLFTGYRYFAQRWEIPPAAAAGGAALVAGANINIPGPLARTWIDGSGVRRFLTHDQTYRTVSFPDRTEWHGDTRLNLLRQIDGNLAELLDARTFTDLSVGSFVIDGGRLFVTAQNQ